MKCFRDLFLGARKATAVHCESPLRYCSRVDTSKLRILLSIVGEPHDCANPK